MSLALAAVGCASDDTERATRASTGDEDGPVYAMQWIVFGDEGETTYVQLTDDIDDKPSLSKAREFGGWGSIGAAGERLFVTEGESPRLSSYVVDGLEWRDEKIISFANTGVESVDFGNIWLLDQDIAYLTLETSNRVVFDPSEHRILEIKEDTKLEPELDRGLELMTAWQRGTRIPDRDGVQIPFYYYSEHSRPGPSVIASYDPETHEEVRLTEVDCEGLEVSSQDEEGNTYYNAWWSWQVGFLWGEVKAPCVARIKPDGTLDEGWPKDFLDQTGGRPFAAWRYVADGKAVATVLHTDEIDHDYEVPGPYYMWPFDLEAGEARRIEDIPAAGYGYYMNRIDGRTFLFIADPEWESTTVYELDVERGTADAVFTTEGWLVDWIQVK